MIRFTIIALLISLLYSCGIPMGNRIDAKNLQVYYLEGVPKEKALEFTKYWKDNGFVGDRKQVMQLDKTKETYTLKLIERAMYHTDPLSIDAQSKLQELEHTLEDEVFNEKVTIIITDNTFRPIERN